MSAGSGGGGRHVGWVIEDHPHAAAVMKEYVQSLDHEVIVSTTLEEVRAVLAERLPCYVLQDIQIPHDAGARPHDKAGESSVRMIRKLSNGPGRVPIIVVTEYRNDPDFVWRMRDLEVDGFVEKSKVEVLPDRVLERLEAAGRADHAACAGCNARSRPAGAGAAAGAVGSGVGAEAKVARVFSHEGAGVAEVTAAEWAAMVERRGEMDSFLDFVTERERGYLAGATGRDGVFREVWLAETHAGIVAELVGARGKAIRATGMKCLKSAGLGSAVRLVQQARKLVDVNAVVDGRVHRTRWRAFKTEGEKGDLGVRFDPPVGFRWGVGVRWGE